MTEKNFWNKALDDLRERMGLESDAELARFLTMSRQMIHQIRAGDRKPPAKVIFMILDKAGYAVTRDMLLALLPDEIAEGLKERDNNRTKKKVTNDAKEKK